MKKQILYVDMDGVIVEFPQTIEEIDPSIREKCRKWCEETGKHHSDFEGLFESLKPAKGGAEAIERLMKKYEVYILSTAPWDNTNAWSDKRRWVQENLPVMFEGDSEFPEKRLILTHRKDLNRGAYLIDDREKKGAKEFGEIDGQEWIHFGSERYPDWDSVLAYLLE
jgi:5'(3')-deoxyribonucleotidase